MKHHPHNKLRLNRMPFGPDPFFVPFSVSFFCAHAQDPIVRLSGGGQRLTVNPNGKRLHSFASGHSQQNLAGLDLLAHGRILVTKTNRNKVVGFDATGKSLADPDAAGARTATGLANGHVLVTRPSNRRVYVLDRAGKVVWEYKNAGHVVRARRR